MKKPASAPAPVPSEEALHAQGVGHVEALEALFQDARSMMAEHRRRSPGRLVYRDAELYEALFGVIEGSRVRAAFDALGAQDQGTDPDRFETELLRAKLARVSRHSGLSQRLRALADRLDDEAMLTGEEVALPSLMALEMARVLAKGNEEFRAKVAPVLNALSAMTAPARKAAAAAKAADGSEEPPAAS